MMKQGLNIIDDRMKAFDHGDKVDSEGLLHRHDRTVGSKDRNDSEEYVFVLEKNLYQWTASVSKLMKQINRFNVKKNQTSMY